MSSQPKKLTEPTISGLTPDPRRAILYLAWGEKYVAEAIASAESVIFMDIPTILITDQASAETIPKEHPFHQVEVVEFAAYNLVAKAYLYDYLPDNFDSFLFLDTDTRVLKDVIHGFEMAELHGIAVAPAPHYGLDCFFGFGRIMVGEGVPTRGQLQYNTGVIFFTRQSCVRQVFELWKELASRIPMEYKFKKTDQPFFSLAMEQCQYRPYCLAPSYNYRALVGEHLVGDAFIWHSRLPVPKNVNDYKRVWPPRAFVGRFRINLAFLQRLDRLLTRLLKRT